MPDFGSDVSSFPDLDATFSPLTGPRVVAEALARRLTTPRGALYFHPDYGTDIRGYLNESVGPGQLSRWKQEIEAECVKDERVDLAKAGLIFDPRVQTLTISIAATTKDGPFRLVLLVTAVTATILDAR